MFRGGNLKIFILWLLARLFVTFLLVTQLISSKQKVYKKSLFTLIMLEFSLLFSSSIATNAQSREGTGI